MFFLNTTEKYTNHNCKCDELKRSKRTHVTTTQIKHPGVSPQTPSHHCFYHSPLCVARSCLDLVSVLPSSRKSLWSFPFGAQYLSLCFQSSFETVFVILYCSLCLLVRLPCLLLYPSHTMECPSLVVGVQ